jgi:hypothetical protein
MYAGLANASIYNLKDMYISAGAAGPGIHV